MHGHLPQVLSARLPFVPATCLFLVQQGKSFVAREQYQGIEEPAEGVDGEQQGLTAISSR